MKNLRPALGPAVLPAFDYDAIEDLNVVQELRETAQKIRELQDAASIGIGRALLAVKDKLEHGQFLDWIESEFAFGRRTAVRMMQVATEFGDKWDTVAHLPTTVLYKLAAPSTPPAVREAVLNLKPGEVVTPRGVQSAIDEVKKGERLKDKRVRRDEIRQEEETARAKREAQDAKDRRERERRIEVARAAAEKIHLLLEDHSAEIAALIDKVDPYRFADEFFRLAQQHQARHYEGDDK